jgi:hypothetical protein
MIVVKKTRLKRAGWVALVILLMVGAIAGVALAADENAVTIVTEPIKIDEAVYVDLVPDGIQPQMNW